MPEWFTLTPDLESIRGWNDARKAANAVSEALASDDPQKVAESINAYRAALEKIDWDSPILKATKILI